MAPTMTRKQASALGVTAMRKHWNRTFEERFWKRVKVGQSDECWPWLGGCNWGGYGKVRRGAKLLTAHRVAFELTNGAIPKGLCALHKCDQRNCCNPSHVFIGTYKDNNRDRAQKGRSRPRRGEDNGRAILTAKDVIKIRAVWDNGGITIAQLARKYSVAWEHMKRIVNRKLWKHI